VTYLSAGALFSYARAQALNAVFLKTQSPAAAATYLAISTSATSGVLSDSCQTMADATINEYNTSTAYARQSYGPTSATNAAPSLAWNTSIITWGPFTSAPGTGNWGILCTAVSGTSANTIGAFLLGTPRTPAIGDSLQAAAGTGSAGVGFLGQI
jgi:hypothetical protein